MMYILGYFAFMIAFMCNAIKTMKMKWYVIGAIFQLGALIVDSTEVYINVTEVIVKWVVYIVVLLATALIIKNKKRKIKE